MKSALALVFLMALGSVAHADDPMPTETPASESIDEPIDEAGTAGENATPAPDPAPATSTRARLTVPTPSPRAIRPRSPGEAGPAPSRPRGPGEAGPARFRARIKDDGESRLDKKEATVAGGTHWRIKTAHGAVHVWIPADYDRATAGTVVYVHGYWTDADGAWRDHELARQFRASRQNAMFIVPDAPSSNDEQVKWPALTDLRRAVTRGNIRLPDGPIIVMGHSGAFRTVMQWVDHRAVDQIILLDAMYAGERAFDDFIKSGKRADDHKLIVVGASTEQGSRAFINKYKFAVAREKLPKNVGGFTRRERTAKLLYVRSQYEHMSIVTSKKVIPLLLRVTPLKVL